MKQSLKLLKAGFESSSGKTPEFLEFVKVFKKEFTKELQSIGATEILFSVGHFYISGFFTIGEQLWYFSLPDVRGMDYALANNPDSHMCKLLYRTAENYNDFCGGVNRYAKIRFDMAADMCWYFKTV